MPSRRILQTAQVAGQVSHLGKLRVQNIKQHALTVHISQCFTFIHTLMDHPVL
jgi:hypothetical protein